MTAVSRRPALVLLILAMVMVAPAMAGFQLVLRNGKVLNGADLARENGNYVLIQASGERVTLAPDMVTEVRILGDEVAAEPSPEEAETDAEAPEEPAGTNLAGGDVSDRIVRSDPTTLAGGEAPELPQLQAETLAGGTDGPLQPGEWRPEGDWGQDDSEWLKDGWVTETPDRTWTPDSDYATDLNDNNWAPSTWTKPAIDPSWQPKGQTVDRSWHPTDGFKKTNSSMRVDLPPTQAGTTPPASVAESAPVAVVEPTGGAFAPEDGPASWYGEAFRGHTTASGKPFDPDALTAAHASLPFGTLVLVTRQDGSGRSVVVEITDRSGAGRIINLSQAAAGSLDMLASGVAEVRVEPVPDQAEVVVPEMARVPSDAVAGESELTPEAGSEEPSGEADDPDEGEDVRPASSDEDDQGPH